MEDQETIRAQYASKFGEYVLDPTTLVVPKRDRVHMLRRKILHWSDERYVDALGNLMHHGTYLVFIRRALSSEIEGSMDATPIMLVDDHVMYCMRTHSLTMYILVEFNIDIVAFHVK